MASTPISVSLVGCLLMNLDQPPQPGLCESDFVMNDPRNPRVVESDKRLLIASKELLHVLSLYSSSRDGDITPFAELPDQPEWSSVEDIGNPEKLSSLVDKILSEQRNQKASISSRFGSVMSKLYPLLSLTLGIGSAIAEGASFLPVKGAVNGLSLLLLIAGQEHTKTTDFLKQLDRISFQALRVAEVKKARVDINDLLLEKAADLMTAILVFFKGALLYLKHDFFHHFFKGILLGPNIYADAKAALDNAINEYDQTLLLQVTLNTIAARPKDHQSESGTTTSDLVSWLQASCWEVESELARHCRNRTNGTFEWIFDVTEFKEWRLGGSRPQARSRSLWLNGLPGVGKSTIAAYIIQALQTHHRQASVLYFFCKSGDSNLDTLPRLVRTLAAQLVPKIPTARYHLETLKENDFKISTPDSVFLYQNLIRDSLKGWNKEIFIVLDGLDECSIESQQADLEALLTNMSSLDVRLLVSSRITAEISSGLFNSQRRELTYEDSQNDIKLYISCCVAKSEGLEKGFQMLNLNPSKFLSGKARGNFLWVKLVLNMLKRKTSEKDFKQVIDTLPKDLEEVYEQLLQRLESRGSLMLALAIFKCVIYSKLSLSIAEMEIAIGLIMEDNIINLVNFVESECGSILRQTPTEPANFYIVHETFQSFITSKSTSGKHCVVPSSSHIQLVAACIKCLLEPDNATFAPFRKYSTNHWLDHLAEGFKDLDPASDDEIRILLFRLHTFFVSQSAVRNWMRDFVFDSTEEYRLATLLASFHNIVLLFLQSDRVCHVVTSNRAGLRQESVGDSGWKEVRVWRDRTVSSGQLALDIQMNFYHVWLNTNWRELDLAKWVVRAAITLDHVLKNTPASQEEMKTRGWKSWNVVHDQPLTTVDAVKNIAALAGFNDQIGIQVGNYAFGFLAADSEECVRWFRDALDECLECWNLHEGLAEYYARHDQRAKAIASLEEALKVDTKEYRSAAFTHATLVANTREDVGDLDGAVEALKEGLKQCPEKDAYRYWDAMAEIFERKGDGNRMADIYKEAVERHPKAGNIFWEKLADTYGRGGARELEWRTYRDAIDKDPENRDKYGEKIRKIAEQLTELCVWPPVPVVLTNGAIEDPDNANKYYRQLGEAYMCQRKWKEALVEFEKYAEKAEDKWVYEDIGHAYLGLGETAKSLAAYEMAFAESSVVAQARSVGYVHIIDGNYPQAIRLFKAALSRLASEDHVGFNFGQADDSNEQRSFHLHLQLGLCYEATSRPDDMKRHLEAAVSALKPIAMKMDEDKERELVYRHEARSLFHIGLVQEKLGLREHAKESLDRAVFLFEKTSMEGDDELQQSEAEEAAAALARVSKVDSEDEIAQLPDLKETLQSMRLQRRLVLPYTTDWYCSQSWMPPKYRGAREWNKVIFVNKFKITAGDRTFIMPWGLGHT